MINKVALVTGASSGIGEITASELAKKGFTVYAAARSVDRMNHLKKYGIMPVYMDLTDEETIVRCVDDILKAKGRIDLLVNNAGYGYFGAVEDVLIDDAKRQFDVNLFGMARLIQLVTPVMRENHSGKIINISSVGCKVWTKFGGWYHAAKFAVEGLSNCLRLELAPFGIDVVVVEPGVIRTNWVMIAVNNLKKTSQCGVYGKFAAKAADSMIKIYSGDMITNPKVVAGTIIKAVMTKRPRTRYLVGFMARPMVWIQKIFGDRAFDWLIKNFT